VRADPHRYEDEIVRPPGHADPRLRVRTLEVVLTASCNLRCTYCYQNAKQGRRMEWDTLRAGLDVVLRSAPPDVKVLFYGGEPLLELPLVRRAVAYVTEARPAGKRVQYVMSTNGMLLDEEAAAFLAEHRFETQVSFDGVPRAQAARGLGTYDKLDALLDRLSVDHPIFYRRDFLTSITLHSGNVQHLADSVDYFLDKRVAHIAMGPLFTHDPGWTEAHGAELDRQFARIFERSLRRYEDTGEVPVELFRKTGAPPRPAPEGAAVCAAGRGDTLAIDVDGQVHGCVTFAESYQRLPSDLLKSRLDPMRMGHVRDEAFPRRLALYPEAARAAGLFHDKQNKHSAYGRCGECRHLAECGVCPTSTGHIPGNTDPDRIPDNMCAYNLVSLAYKERFPRQADPLERLTGRAPQPRLLRELRAFAGG
jgi:sulfatase maturation enzyme AslB (radical SAM superfamily)